MTERIDKVLDMWENKVDLRNAYIFGDENIELPEFAELFKQTFEIIKNVKSEYMQKNIVPQEAFTYLRLLTTLSKYTTCDCVEDQSENKTFAATALIAQTLVDYATFEWKNNDEENQGIFSLDRDEYPYYCDVPQKTDNKFYSYNIYDGNFEEILELAADLGL